MTKINTGDLDFSKIKENLKTFLSSQSELTDYDFDGSVLSTIIDVLAANTHYNALYTNMAINEMFIDSASKRSSIASIAKLMGYVPKSIKSAKAVLSITMTTPTALTGIPTIPAGTKFTTEVDGNDYIFNLLEDKTGTTIGSNTYQFTNVNVYEGTVSSVNYTKSANTKFVVPDPDADVSSLVVKVDGETYTYANSLVDVNSTSKVYFLKQLDDVYEVYFGEGTFGVAIVNGANVSIKYLKSSGASANFAALFSYAGGANSTYTYYVTSTLASYGGANQESKESIRYFAPLYYQSQGRAVTTSDYAAIVADNYPEIETMSVWGGQDNIPPQFGKVFIAVKPTGRDVFTDSEKYEMKSGIISKRSIISVTPVFVDPKYYDVDLSVSVYYDPAKTSLESGQIQAEVLNTISNYNTQITAFDKSYRHSVLMNNISDSDSSIVSVIGTHRIRTSMSPIFGVLSDYSIDFKNPISQSTSSTFYSTRVYISDYIDRGYFKNDGTDIYFYTEDISGTPTKQNKYGTIDYSGKITMDRINITGLYDDAFEFVFYPSSYDVIPKNGYITRIPEKYRTVSVLVDALSRNNKADHVFTPSK